MPNISRRRAVYLAFIAPVAIAGIFISGCKPKNMGDDVYKLGLEALDIAERADIYTTNENASDQLSRIAHEIDDIMISTDDLIVRANVSALAFDYDPIITTVDSTKRKKDINTLRKTLGK